MIARKVGLFRLLFPPGTFTLVIPKYAMLLCASGLAQFASSAHGAAIDPAVARAAAIASGGPADPGRAKGTSFGVPWIVCDPPRTAAPKACELNHTTTLTKRKVRAASAVLRCKGISINPGVGVSRCVGSRQLRQNSSPNPAVSTSGQADVMSMLYPLGNRGMTPYRSPLVALCRH
jgi:hypothetical protein